MRRLMQVWGLLFIVVVISSFIITGLYEGQRSALERLDAFDSRVRQAINEKDELIKQLRQELAETERRLSDVEETLREVRVIAQAIARFDPPTDSMILAGQVYTSSKRYGVDPLLVVAVGGAESDWRINARGRKGEYGPMQLMPSTFRYLGGKDPSDWRENVDLGTKYLAMMLERAGGDERLAVAYYNAGPSRPAHVVRSLSKRHVNRVMDFRL